MGESIDTHKEKAKDMQADKDYIRDCVVADEQAQKQKEQEKMHKRQKSLEVKNFLDTQVFQKKQQRKLELASQVAYIERVKQQDESARMLVQ